MNFNSIILIIANLSKEFVICRCLCVELIPRLFLPLTPHIWAEHGHVLLQIFPTSSAFPVGMAGCLPCYFLIFIFFSESENAKRELQCLGTIFMSKKSPHVCLLLAEWCLPNLAGALLPQGQLHGGTPWEVSGAGDEQTSKLLFAGEVSPTLSPTGAMASLCSQALNMLTLQIQLIVPTFLCAWSCNRWQRWVCVQDLAPWAESMRGFV